MSFQSRRLNSDLDSEPVVKELPLAVIVSLRSASKRRQFMRRGMEKAGISYVFIDATEGTALNEDWLSKNVLPDLWMKILAHTDSELARNIIACADSHRRAQNWIRQQSNDEYFIIFEDDAKLESEFFSIWPKLQEAMNRLKRDVIFLGYSLPTGAETGQTLVQLGAGYELLEYPVGKTLGAFGYLLNPKGAEMLLELNRQLIIDTADNFHIHHRGLAQNVAVLAPKIVTTGYLASSIGWDAGNLFRTFKRLLLRTPVLRSMYNKRQRLRY